MAIANLALRFVLELAGVAAFAIWGFQLAGQPPLALLTGAGAAAAMILVWARFLAPRAASPLTQPQRDLAGTVILCVAALALAAAGQPAAGLVLGLLTIVNAAILAVLGPAARDAFGPSTASSPVRDRAHD